MTEARTKSRAVSVDDLALGSTLDDASAGPLLRSLPFDAGGEKATEASPSPDSSQQTDFANQFATERQEHPSFSDSQVAQIVRDHMAAGKDESSDQYSAFRRRGDKR
jgi:hypothetical protein